MHVFSEVSLGRWLLELGLGSEHYKAEELVLGWAHHMLLKRSASNSTGPGPQDTGLEKASNW